MIVVGHHSADVAEAVERRAKERDDTLICRGGLRVVRVAGFPGR